MSENDASINEDGNGVKINDSDIVFECEHCGKSFVIESAGAGMVIQCPDCHNDIRVPEPEPESDEESEAEETGGSGLDIESPRADLGNDETVLRETSDTSADSDQGGADDSLSDRDKLAAMSSEIEELRARRRYLEKMRADHARIFQNIARQVIMLQTAVKQLADFLKIAQESSEDTQEID